jgi:acetyltransferase-like isoleucine patch superfamily enzyme
VNVPKLIKVLVMSIAVVLVSPLLVLAWLERLTSSERLFVSMSQALSMIPNLPGQYLRAAFYALILPNFSWESHVGFGSVFSHRDVALGKHVSLGNYCVIGHVAIGPSAMIGSRVSIPSGKRQHFNDGGELSIDSNHYDRIQIGGGCWIGEGAIVMADVGEGAIISAGAVVVTPIPKGAVAGGNPAKILKYLE